MEKEREKDRKNIVVDKSSRVFFKQKYVII